MLSFLDWIDAVRYRWKLVVVASLVFFLLGVVYVGIAPRMYEATARLLVDANAPDPLEEKSGAWRDSRSVMATQADLVRTPSVALGAAELGGFSKDPNYIAQWREVTGGRISLAQWIRPKLLGALAVEPQRDTNVLLIRANAPTAAEAAMIANGFAHSAVQTQHRLRTQPAKAYAAWLETQIKSARQDVRTAQERLSEFVRVSGITNDGNLGSEGAQMAEVATQLAAAEARAAAARQSSFAGEQSIADAENSATIQGLRRQVSEKTGKLAELEAVFGPEYPDVQRTRAELKTLQSQLGSQVAAARSAFTASRSAQAAAERAAATASEARLRALTEEQRARMMTMGTNLAQYSTLRNEFQAAQANFNDINQRLSRMRLQGNLPQTEVKVVDTASPPLLPTYPRVGFILVVALLLGALVGSALAIILEAMNPRVRSWGSIERMLGVPVVGRIPAPAKALHSTPRLTYTPKLMRPAE